MDQATLAEALVAADPPQRTLLLIAHAHLAETSLAEALKLLYDQAVTNDPARAAEVAAAVRALAEHTPTPSLRAYAEWLAGLAELHINGQAEAALTHLNAAASHFAALDLPLLVATVQVSRLHALAMLGRYDEAVESGLAARRVLVAHDDELGAAKIAHNIGNIYWRRDDYGQAEHFYNLARAQYIALGREPELAIVESNLATVKTSQYQFQAAAQLYQQALARAEANGAAVTEALIEVNLGWLGLSQGHYQAALEYLERARRRYSGLGMPHESATVELELADAYLELNLVPEAAAIYSRVRQAFVELGMRAELAHTLAYASRADMLLGQFDTAHTSAREAGSLYQAEGNRVGAALVSLTEAQLALRQGLYDQAARIAAQAEPTFAEAGAVGNALLARWLQGESARLQQEHQAAERLLTTALAEAEQQTLLHIAHACCTSLGLLALADDPKRARQFFERATTLIELLRAPLPAEELRTSFLADKLTPYTELVRLALRDTTPEHVADAFQYVERARARAMLDVVGGAFQPRRQTYDAAEADMQAHLARLSEELNWLYSQINRPPDGDADSKTIQQLYADVREREASVLELTRQLQHHGGAVPGQAELASLADIQRDIGENAALVAYFGLDDELLAFVVTNRTITVHRQLASMSQVQSLVRQLHFQIDALRYGPMRSQAHATQLEHRTRRHLAALYNLLIRPFAAELGERRLVVVPFRVLHYVPFHALDTGESYLIEQREVCYAPSASVLHYSRIQPRSARGAVLAGIADEQTPAVGDELDALSQVLADSVVLRNETATIEALRQHASPAGVLHLASHAHFRPDNPYFSALKLHGGWLTVRDARELDLHAALVTLSGCETGVSTVAPGDELLGLMRGFLAAGAAALLVSLWAVNDATTTEQMIDFYTRLQAGDAAPTALRYAQCRALARNSHPFYWAPFVYIGW